MSLQYFEEKNYHFLKYLFIAILCAKICVTWTFGSLSCSQFHLHFTNHFFPLFSTKILQTQTVRGHLNNTWHLEGEAINVTWERERVNQNVTCPFLSRHTRGRVGIMSLNVTLGRGSKISQKSVTFYLNDP